MYGVVPSLFQAPPPPFDHEIDAIIGMPKWLEPTLMDAIAEKDGSCV